MSSNTSELSTKDTQSVSKRTGSYQAKEMKDLASPDPLNENTCVKVIRTKHRSQNKIEKYYYTKLKKAKQFVTFHF